MLNLDWITIHFKLVTINRLFYNLKLTVSNHNPKLNKYILHYNYCTIYTICIVIVIALLLKRQFQSNI